MKYVVKDEHTLGYLRGDQMGVLAGSVMRGGHDWKNGEVHTSGAKIRAATLADFDTYRVQVPPDFVT